MNPAGDGGGGTGLLLHLAGPLQSWGENSPFSQRGTARFPTRSGVIGLLACALGRTRGADIGDLTALSLTVRTDRPGVPLRDLHTVGGGLPAARTVTTADGRKRSGATATLLSHRYYLADAVFTAVLTGESDTLRECARALEDPVWPPYLGRRSCPPEGPLLLGLSEAPLHHLVHLPLARCRTPDDAGVRVDFHSDGPLGRLTPSGDSQDGDEPVGHVTDEPDTFHPRRRSYRPRTRYQRTLTLPAERCAGLGADYLTVLGAYLRRHITRPGSACV
ncbi:type I-E CRISPR-associated protein Cas5/CasD (plasmid) [Kitasatospora sp. NBC_00070]|uniref:type I-E CRISPR-associated protein Cas5/CasD n=1 Tax=Kitasatospora sp. NBC_00070 TaxID=2975962 RepID=UPI002F918891